MKLAIFTLFLGPFLPFKGPILHSAWVLDVHDGDSVTLKWGAKIIKSRLLYIDAPELGQTCEGERIGEQSKDFLNRLILNKKVSFITHGKDIYQRYLVEVFYQNHSVSLTMVKEGTVLLYAQSRFPSLKEKKTFLDAFWQARKNKLGLHRCSILETPKHYRKRQKKSLPRNTKLT